jgi:hypothetical protein
MLLISGARHNSNRVDASHQSLKLASEAEPCHSKGKKKRKDKRKAMNAKAY